MGMFDDIRCKYPLPVDGANALDYQTKDTPMQFLDLYEIQEDGTLWHETYDTEDHSEAAKWQAANPGKELPEKLNGLASLCGCATRVNKRWESVPDFTGEIRFYTHIEDRQPYNEGGWVEWSSYFVGGKLQQLHLVEHRLPGAQNK